MKMISEFILAFCVAVVMLLSLSNISRIWEIFMQVKSELFMLP